MTTALFVVAVVAAASLCPALMWWNARRGRAASCMPRRSRTESAELEAARREQASLARRVEALGGAAPDASARAASKLSGDLRGG
jgi:Flp pilus assembly protein TadB